MRNISQENIKRIVIPLPPEEELYELLKVYDLMAGAAAEATQGMSRLAAREKALRQSILKAAFEGRLVPQDPADEPASALLARLREVSPGADASRGRRGRKRNRPEPLELPLFAAHDDRPSGDAG
jgi:type I restriction enzyme S subunit